VSCSVVALVNNQNLSAKVLAI